MNAVGIALVWCAVQVTLVGLLAGGLYLVVRRLQPAAGAPVTMTGLLTIVALSAMALSPWPRWSFGLWKAEARSEAPRDGQGSSLARPNAPVASTGADSPQAAAVPGQETAPGGSFSGPLFLHALVDELAQPTPQPGAATWRWPAVVAVLFLSAVAAGTAWLAVGLMGVRAYRVGSGPIQDAELLKLADVLRAALGCRRPIELRQCDALVTAAAIGWRRPILLLPAEWTGWTHEQRRAVLAHEIAHVRARHFLGVLFGQLGLVLHFYHPLVHWLMSRLRLEQELAADAAAAGALGGKQRYLTAIAKLALRERDRSLVWPARAFLPTQTTFLRRIIMLRDAKLRHDRLSPAARVLLIGTVLVCGLAVAGLRGPASDGGAQADQMDQAAAGSIHGQAETSSAGKESASLEGTWSAVHLKGASRELGSVKK